MKAISMTFYILQLVKMKLYHWFPVTNFFYRNFFSVSVEDL